MNREITTNTQKAQKRLNLKLNILPKDFIANESINLLNEQIINEKVDELVEAIKLVKNIFKTSKK